MRWMRWRAPAHNVVDEMMARPTQCTRRASTSPPGPSDGDVAVRSADENATASEGLSLVHYSAQRKRLLWDSGCMYGLFWGCSEVFRGVQGVFCVRNGSD